LFIVGGAPEQVRCVVLSIFVAVVLLTPCWDSPGAETTKFELVITLKAAKQVGLYNFSQRVGASDKLIG